MTQCPTSSTLAKFTLGNLGDAQFERVAGHVRSCPRCEAELGKLDSQRDELVDAIGELDIESMAELSPLEPASQFADQLTESLPFDFESEVTFDAGRRFSLRLRQGACRIGRFDLLEEIGVGAFGHVFRARDTELDRIVALKVHRASGFAAQEEKDQFLREARNASALKHPHIVTLYETGHTEDGVCFLVSEFVAGETLADILRRGPLAPPLAASLLAKLADAVHYAHENGVVHRDIKPANIIVDQQHNAHIADFGLAKRDSIDAATSDGRIMGTPAYMSPEQARGDVGGTDNGTDIYSLGVVLYEMLTGQRPFQGSKRLLLLQVLEDEPKPVRQLNAQVPIDLETICLKAMAKSRAGRYRTAQDLAADLRAHLNGDPIKARRVGVPERLWNWCRRYPLAAAIFLGVTLGAGLGFAYLRNLNTWFVQQTALDTARQYADALEEFNATYSDARAEFFGHGGDTGSVPPPLPATLQIEVAERISRREDGMNVRIYSPYSFRNALRPRGEFENSTLEKFRQQLSRGSAPPGSLENYEFMTIDDRSHLKFARGQLMKSSCIECHNSHKSSPKRDWKEGDWAGVLTLTRPLDRDIRRTESGFRGASALMLAVAAFMTLCGIALSKRRRPRADSTAEFWDERHVIE